MKDLYFEDHQEALASQDEQDRLFHESVTQEEEAKKELHQMDLEEYIDELNKNTPDPLPENFKPF